MNRRIGQIALVVGDHMRSAEFYARVFGMDHIFGTSEFRGEQHDEVQQLKNVASSCRWLIDDREMFQLEIFTFENPVSMPLAEDHSVYDEGYNRVIIAVKSLKETIALAVDQGAKLSALLPGDNRGQSTHALIQDIDGIFLELIEAPDQIPGERPACIIGLGITSLDLSTTVEDMCDGYGFTPCEDKFEFRDSWLEGERLERFQMLQLDDMYLVVSQYSDGRPHPLGYRMQNVGIMNFALCFPTAEDFDACYSNTKQMGMKPNIEPVIVENMASITYNNDRQGFSVEMIFMVKKYWGMYGFALPTLKDRLLSKFVNWKARRDYKKYINRPGH